VHYNCLVRELQHSNCKPEMHTLFAFFSSIPDLYSTHTNITVSRLNSDTWVGAFVDSHDQSDGKGKDHWGAILHSTSVLILKKHLLACLFTAHKCIPTYSPVDTAVTKFTMSLRMSARSSIRPTDQRESR
jgi:hypothetical protein